MGLGSIASSAPSWGRTEIQLHAYDETNTRIKPRKIIRSIRQNGGRGFIGFVGVQSNQFSRAVDLARPFLPPGFR